ncbi:MAG: SagB/ThcOx family dehydrogenase [Kiritimatiellae bacterium]|nr:SagB/ThcOx family dehydrogenase [Kiritimatiellia bacterium]
MTSNQPFHTSFCASRLLLAVFLGCVFFASAEKKSAAAKSAPAPLRGVDALSLSQRRAFLRGTLADWRLDTDDHRGIAPPPIQKPYAADARRLDLIAPDKFAVGSMSVREAIRERRSRRDYSDALFSLEELSYLLWATQGISKLERDEDGELLAQYRTVPSGGAKHPFESYLLINRVAGVAPGLYRYLPIEHQLLVIREGAELGTQVTAACYGQSFIGEAAVTFIWAAIPYRSEWKYGSIAEKIVALDMGHLCQNLYLAVESIQAGMCAVMGYNQARMDALLGLDGENEFVIYLAASGKIR